MKHIVYKTTNKVNGKIYVGKHSTENINDYYLGSGSTIRNAISKYGKEHFYREILEVFDDEDEAYLYENKIVDKDFVKRGDTYNEVEGGRGNARFGFFDDETGIFYEHAMQCENIKEKARKTNIEKYGVEYPMQNEEIKEKAKSTHLYRYGVEYTLQDPIKRNKSMEALEAKYGTLIPLQNEEVKEKYDNTMIERHGNSVPLRNEKIKEKYDNTIMQKYGVDHISKVPEIAKKANDSRENTVFQKYGVKNWNQTEEARTKAGERMKGSLGVNIDKITITNGVDIRFISKDEKIPEGWIKGMKTKQFSEKMKIAAMKREKQVCDHCGKSFDPGNYKRHIKSLEKNLLS